MNRQICRTVVLTGILLAPAHVAALAQRLPEPTLDERFQNGVDSVPESDLPLLNPPRPIPPAANPPAATPRTATGPAYLGVTFNSQFRNAAVVRTVTPGSPADQAGLQPGDAIETLQGRPINSYGDVQDIIAQMRSGDVLQIEFSRRITARTQAALEILPSASERSVGYPPDAEADDSTQRPRAEQPPPRNRSRAAPPNNRNTPQNQNRAAPNNERDDFRGRGFFFRRR